MEKYVEILKNNNIKITPQRLLVLRYLYNNFNHPTAEKIYSDLKKDNPSLSKTTIYNSLETLEKHGIIQALTISGSELRYDIKHEMHHHFYCKRCGRIIDIEIKCPNIKKMSEFGHRIDEIHGYIKGICKSCIKSKVEEDNESKDTP